MGCIQSRSKRAKNCDTPCADSESKSSASAALAAKTAAVETTSSKRKADTAVLRRASAFDLLDETAHKAPELKKVESVKVGEKNAKLLAGFEAAEAAARAPPVLQSVERKDLRNSKLFSKLQEYEAKDAAAAAEPKLEKTFSQRQAERAMIAAS